MKRLGVLVAIVLLAGCTSDKVEDSLQEQLPADVEVVDNSCSQSGKTKDGYDHWVCVLHYPETAVTPSMNRRWDVAVDGDGNVVASSPQR